MNANQAIGLVGNPLGGSAPPATLSLFQIDNLLGPITRQIDGSQFEDLFQNLSIIVVDDESRDADKDVDDRHSCDSD
jgi:hypothetical protein